ARRLLRRRRHPLRAALAAGALAVAVAVRRVAALRPDLRHVLAVLAHHLTALAAGRTGLLGVEFVRRALLVRRPAALARDLSLLLRLHPREATASAVFPLFPGVVRHCSYLVSRSSIRGVCGSFV